MSNDTIDKFTQACSTNNLPEVELLFTEWQKTVSPEVARGETGLQLHPLSGGLEVAVRNRHASIVAYLLKNGVGITPDVVGAASNSSTDVLQAMTDAGWNINQSPGGHTPDVLTTAVIDGDLERTLWILQHGADPNTNTHGLRHTTLESAIQHSTGTEMVGLILKHGAKVKDTRAMLIAAEEDRDDLIQLLIEYGGEVNGLLDEDNFFVLYPDRYANVAPLHVAAREGKVDVTRALLRAGADKTLKDLSGKTPAQIALTSGHEALAKELA